jgi:hypothetical protein
MLLGGLLQGLLRGGGGSGVGVFGGWVRERRWGLRRVGEGGLSCVRREGDEDGSRVTRQEGSGRCGWASREGKRRLDEKLFVRRV